MSRRRGRSRSRRTGAARGVFRKLNVQSRLPPAKGKVGPAGTGTGPRPKPIMRVNRLQQNGHVFGTNEYKQRLRDNKPTSYFYNRREANRYTYEAWYKGQPVRGDPSKREFDFGRPVGVGPGGGQQTKVRVHMDADGNVHGHPSGREIR